MKGKENVVARYAKLLQECTSTELLFSIIITLICDHDCTYYAFFVCLEISLTANMHIKCPLISG